MHLDRRLVLAGVVDDLADDWAQHIGGETRAALLLAFAAHRFGPLFIQPGKAQIVQRRGAAVGLALVTMLEQGFRVGKYVFVGHLCPLGISTAPTQALEGSGGRAGAAFPRVSRETGRAKRIQSDGFTHFRMKPKLCSFSIAANPWKSPFHTER